MLMEFRGAVNLGLTSLSTQILRRNNVAEATMQDLSTVVTSLVAMANMEAKQQSNRSREDLALSEMRKSRRSERRV